MSDKPWSKEPPQIKFGYDPNNMKSYPLTEEGITKAVEAFPALEGLSLKDALGKEMDLTEQYLSVVYDLLCIAIEKKIEANDISQDNLDYVMPLIDHAAKLYRDNLMEIGSDYAKNMQGLTNEFTVTQDLMAIAHELSESKAHEDTRAYLGLVYYMVAANTDIDPCDYLDEQTNMLFSSSLGQKQTLN